MRLRLSGFAALLILFGCVPTTTATPAASTQRAVLGRQVDEPTGPAPSAPALMSEAVQGVLAPAVRVSTRQVVEPPPIVHLFTPPTGARCPEWWTTAGDVGWPLDAMPVLDYVMFRESRCRPGATGIQVCSRGRCARALGLTQLLGWACPPDGCLDPVSNLRRALILWEASGWRPWCLDGDPVTGSC